MEPPSRGRHSSAGTYFRTSPDAIRRAIASSAARSRTVVPSGGICDDGDRERMRTNIALRLPGLANPESQLGVPLLVRGELVGVLCVESEIPYRFHEEDKATIELLGSYLAIAIQNMQMQERAADADDAAPGARERFEP